MTHCAQESNAAAHTLAGASYRRKHSFLIPPSCKRHDHRLIKVAKVKIKKQGEMISAAKNESREKL